MCYLGIDIGTSNIKIIETDEKLNIKNKLILEKIDSKEAIQKFININKINIRNIEKIAITGVGANEIEIGLGIETTEIPEFIAIGNAGKVILETNQKDFIVASAGTGTAFIKNEHNVITHCGGTGVGGGTLINLCKIINPKIDFNEINLAINEGNLENVDLTIQDVTTQIIETLPKDVTAVNFGKLNKNANSKDIILGIVNMIFETIGVMSAFIAKGNNIQTIIVTGQIAKMPYARKVLDKVQKLHNVSFVIPKNAEYMTALGAIIEVKKYK